MIQERDQTLDRILPVSAAALAVRLDKDARKKFDGLVKEYTAEAQKAAEVVADKGRNKPKAIKQRQAQERVDLAEAYAKKPSGDLLRKQQEMAKRHAIEKVEAENLGKLAHQAKLVHEKIAGQTLKAAYELLLPVAESAQAEYEKRDQEEAGKLGVSLEPSGAALAFRKTVRCLVVAMGQEKSKFGESNSSLPTGWIEGKTQSRPDGSNVERKQVEKIVPKPTANDTGRAPKFPKPKSREELPDFTK